MKAQINYGLQGAFKVDLFSGEKFMESTDWFSNFITHTGLSYPSIYAFADCFRFLSIGSDSNTANYGFSASNLGQAPTTGLSAPFLNFNTNVGQQPGIYMGWQAYEIGLGNGDSPCGTQLTETGPSFFRAWSIPSGDISIVCTQNGGLNIGEFMVSPSSGSDPSGCFAFSRVIRPLTIPSGWRAIVSYQLKVKIQNTGLTNLANAFTTGRADITNDPDLVASWAALSGYYRQVYHGLACVDSKGATFIPTYGAVMEPSIKDLSSCSFYLSPDNAAFDVNAQNGGAIGDIGSAYTADGLMQQYFVHHVPLTWDGQDNFSTLGDGDKAIYYLKPLEQRDNSGFPANEDVNIPQNIRLGNDSNGLVTPSTFNYSLGTTNDIGTNYTYQQFNYPTGHEISYATPGVLGVNPSKVNFGQKAVFSTRVFQLPVFNPTGRKKTQTRRTMFAPVSALGYNTRFGSLVFGFNSDTSSNYPSKVIYPIIDCLFFNSQGRSLMQHYRLITGIFFTQRGTGVADAYISISPHAENTQQFYNRRTFQGAISAGQPITNDWVQANPQFLMGGETNDRAGDINYSDISINNSGYGGVLGIVGQTAVGVNPIVDYTQLLLDQGLIDHNVISIGGQYFVSPLNGSPSNSGFLYWPSVNSQPLTLSISGIVFSDGTTLYADKPNLSAATLALSGFCRPTGYIVHVENIGSSGFRLLPNHGIPNNQNLDAYSPKTGGYYPGLSLDNGLDLYLDISWNAPCSGALNCDEAH